MSALRPPIAAVPLPHIRCPGPCPYCPSEGSEEDAALLPDPVAISRAVDRVVDRGLEAGKGRVGEVVLTRISVCQNTYEKMKKYSGRELFSSKCVQKLTWRKCLFFTGHQYLCGPYAALVFQKYFRTLRVQVFFVAFPQVHLVTNMIQKQ